MFTASKSIAASTAAEDQDQEDQDCIRAVSIPVRTFTSATTVVAATSLMVNLQEDFVTLHLM